MILIITHKLDFTADFLINKLNDKSIDYFRLNCEDIPKLKYVLTEEDEFSLDLNGNKSFKSVWFRRTKLPDIDIPNLDERLYLANEYDALLSNFYGTIPTNKWLSDPKSIYRAENKLLQLKIAQKLGFNIPKTIVTNDIVKLREFAKDCDSNLIIKPLSVGRIETQENVKIIYTNKVRTEHLENLEEFTLTPAIFQKCIAKEFEIRVTVVRDKVFAAKVNSQEEDETRIDWRRKKLKFTPYILPAKLQGMCIALLRKLNISFGAIDLIKTPSGEYFFLEINPNGQWAWLEIEGGLEISKAIIEFLSE